MPSLSPRAMKRAIRAGGSWKKEGDDPGDDPLEKGDQRVEDAQVEQADDDEKSIGLYTGQGILKLGRRETHEDFRAIQRRNGNKIEGRQHDIDLGHVNQEGSHGSERSGV